MAVTVPRLLVTTRRVFFVKDVGSPDESKKLTVTVSSVPATASTVGTASRGVPPGALTRELIESRRTSAGAVLAAVADLVITVPREAVRRPTSARARRRRHETSVVSMRSLPEGVDDEIPSTLALAVVGVNVAGHVV